MSVVGVKNDIQVIDVTGAAAILNNRHQQQQQQQLANHSDNTVNNDNDITDANQKTSKKNEIIENNSLNSVTATNVLISTTSHSVLSLPQQMIQYEIRSPAADKDHLAYLFILKVSR